MKKWNTPSIQELNLSATMQHGQPHQPVDGVIYDVERDSNWFTFSGNQVNHDVPEGDVNIHN